MCLRSKKQLLVSNKGPLLGYTEEQGDSGLSSSFHGSPSEPDSRSLFLRFKTNVTRHLCKAVTAH